MKRPPLIGLTTYPRPAKGGVRLPTAYVDSVRRAGGIPLLLAPGEQHIDVLLELIDGLILTGGGDVHPDFFDEPVDENADRLDKERDEFELALTDRMLEMQMPSLCICRGLQVLNVAMGGTLIQDIPTALPNGLQHRDDAVPPQVPILHPVQVDDSSRLAEIMQTGDVAPASWHHQSIDKVAPGMEVIAKAADGIIEAVEVPKHPQLIAVQWHPEMTAAEDETQQRIFDEFVKMTIS